MPTVIPNQADKCKGAMLATAIGDALGWPNEPRSRNRIKKPKVTNYFVEWTRSSKFPRWHDEKIFPGEYSDDTQLTLSVARSLIAGNWEKFFSDKELPFWLNYERGGGGALLKAARSYQNGRALWHSNYARDYFNAGGNGATMRILPHVIVAAQTPNTTALLVEVIKDSIITHGHPRAILGATCYAYALDYLLKKDTILEYGELVTAVINGQKDWGASPKSEIFGDWLNIANQHCDYNFAIEWENTRINMLHQLEYIKTSLKKGLILDDTKVLSELGCFDQANGAGDVAILAAIYLASRYANNPMLAIAVPAFLFGADTDTIASITGGLVGMLCGTNWIPSEWKSVQDYDCIIHITELLLATNLKEPISNISTEAKVKNGDWVTTQIGKMRIVDTRKVLNGKNGYVEITKWLTALGQTLYTKNFQPFDAEYVDHPIVHHQIDIYDASLQVQNSQGVQTKFPAKVTSLEQGNVTTELQARKFTLSLSDVTNLLENPSFKKNITAGKILKIIKSLLEGQETSLSIAEQFNVELAVVEAIRKYIVFADKSKTL